MVELMATILIIAVLAMIVLGISNYATNSNEKKRCVADMDKIRNGLDEYRAKFNKYVDFSANTADQRFVNELKKAAPSFPQLDPWGMPFRYEAVSKFSYKLYSLGPDTNNAMDDVSIESGIQ